jgi:hypothetical protein
VCDGRRACGAVKLTPKQEFKAVGDVALLAASPHLEHQVSANWSEKNEKVLEDWKKDVAEKIKECDAHAKYQVRGLWMCPTMECWTRLDHGWKGSRAWVRNKVLVELCLLGRIHVIWKLMALIQILDATSD